MLNADAAASTEALTAHKVMPHGAAPLLTAAANTAYPHGRFTKFLNACAISNLCKTQIDPFTAASL